MSEEKAKALLQLVKQKARDPLKYAKLVYDPKMKVYRLKLVLLRPMSFRTLQEIAQAAEGAGFEVQIYAPHARALRLDLKPR